MGNNYLITGQDFSIIISIFQLELNNYNKNALYNQIKFFTLDDQKQILDLLSSCDVIQTPIHYAIKEDTNLDIPVINEFKDKGVDIFHIKDEFCNDICHPYAQDNNYVILKDRRKYLFQNYSLCEEGCFYNNINTSDMTVICNCKIQENFSDIETPFIFEQPSEISFFESNIGIIKCHNQIFH